MGPRRASKSRNGPTHMSVVLRPILSEMRPAARAPIRPPMTPAAPATPCRIGPSSKVDPTALMAALRTMPSNP